MRLLFECTHVFDHPHVNSGIQRVVRNVIGNLRAQDAGVECLPVILKNGKIYEVRKLVPEFRERILSRIQAWFERCINHYWLMHHRLEQLLGLSSHRYLRWLVWQACRAGSLTFILPWKLFSLIVRENIEDQRKLELNCRPGDVLVLLDSSWHSNLFADVERLKTAGVGIVAVVYDLIPLTHPQFFDGQLAKVFARWFEWVTNTADGFIAISATISDQVRADVERRLGTGQAARRWYSHFHLGSELDQSRVEGHVRKAVRGLFSEERSVYLMVSTIEPRKNHAYLLDAFERLWASDSQAVLCIVGSVGWRCAPLIARIKKHRELGRQLFMFNDLSDTELEFCYQRSRALVFPSFVEGFGLPLVEAMQRGLPAMASDIPVFREIGADFLAYFDLNDSATLAALVRKFEDSGKFPAARALNEWSWPGWCDSTRQLIQRISSNTLEQRPTASQADSLQTT